MEAEGARLAICLSQDDGPDLGKAIKAQGGSLHQAKWIGSLIDFNTQAIPCVSIEQVEGAEVFDHSGSRFRLDWHR
ncbi:hypothetical protein D9M68_662560 [compost metagenome]